MKRCLAALIAAHSMVMGKPCSDAAALVSAVNQAAVGARIELAAGTFALSQPLVLKSGMQLIGQGAGKTIITHILGWRGNAKSLPDPETDFRKFDRSAYLIHLTDQAAGVTISRLTLTGPQMHGAIYGWENSELTLSFAEIRDFQYCGLRTYITSKSKIHDCVFQDAGQRWENGEPDVKGGATGGGIFAIWISDTEIHNNRFLHTRTAPNEHYYGIKGREGRRLKIHHNTIETNFSIEFPFEGDEDVEISHNVLHGTVSIPKHAGGPVPKSGRTFHIHHNLFRDSYSIEFVRNGVEIDHNLFDFDPQKDHGNLISGFGGAAAPGPAVFHNNLVNNPGRGVIWINEPYANLTVRNNHIVVRPTVSQRTDGLFGFHEACDFTTFRFENNIIDCINTTRPLFRNDASGRSLVRGNRWKGITDETRYQNGPASHNAGPEGALKFSCGVDGETTVSDWNSSNKK